MHIHTRGYLIDGTVANRLHLGRTRPLGEVHTLARTCTGAIGSVTSQTAGNGVHLTRILPITETRMLVTTSPHLADRVASQAAGANLCLQPPKPLIWLAALVRTCARSSLCVTSRMAFSKTRQRGVPIWS